MRSPGSTTLTATTTPALKKTDFECFVRPDGRFTFVRGDLTDAALVERLFAEKGFDVVVNLAAKAGVRYSIDNPRAYIDSNLIGFYNVLEACRHHPVKHLVFASSSSVYGGNERVPFSEADQVDHPVSLYAATKKANELMAHAYSKLYGIPCTGLRFFTVYGPMGRPDMAYFKFADTLRAGGTIRIHNMGDCRRDFTYVDDIVEGVVRVMGRVPEDCGTGARYKVYNIGNSEPVQLLEFVDTLQHVLVEEEVLPEGYDFDAHKELVPMQPGDVVGRTPTALSLSATSATGRRPGSRTGCVRSRGGTGVLRVQVCDCLRGGCDEC